MTEEARGELEKVSIDTLVRRIVGALRDINEYFPPDDDDDEFDDVRGEEGWRVSDLYTVNKLLRRNLLTSDIRNLLSRVGLR